MGESNARAVFRPGEVWLDTSGSPIQAHGGQMQRLELPDEDGVPRWKWVWVGEDKTAGAHGGIRAYSSDDLVQWRCEGVIMRNVANREELDTDPYFQLLYGKYTPEQKDRVFTCLSARTAIIERPKLLYNERTGLYLLWFHADGPLPGVPHSYAAACAGLAVSEKPFGPYRFVDRYRLNVCPPDQEDKFPKSRGMARDMNVFKDDDGTAYIIYSSEENYTLYISRLNRDYTYLATPPERAVCGVDFVRIFPGGHREAPALFKRDEKYYLITSGCTGWKPNQARWYCADNIFGPWTDCGDPCVGDEKHTTFDSQSTCVFREPESGVWIYMGDRWNPKELGDSRYIWLPIHFDEEGGISIAFTGEWSLDRIP